MRATSWVVGTLVLSICALPFRASAQAPAATATPSASADPATARARDLYSEGAKLFNEGQYERARVSFAAAYAIMPHPENARALADCEWALEKWRDAAEHYAVFFASEAGRAENEKTKVARRRFDEARARIGTVRPAITPATALVTVGGRIRRAADLPAEIFVEPGSVKVEASANGFEADEATVVVKAGEAADVRLTLHPVAAPHVTAAPWKPPVGLVIGSGIFSLVGLGAGFGLAVAAQNQAAEANLQDKGFAGDTVCYQRVHPSCEKLRERWAAVDATSNAAVGAFVAGGAFAIVAGSLLIWRSTVPDKPTLQMKSVVSSQGGAMIMSGTW